MNVYDFDDTIYKGDSTVDFILFVFFSQPIILIKNSPFMIKAYLLHKLGKVSTKELKEVFFKFLKDIDNLEYLVEKFWDANESKIKAWYLSQKRSDDVIISAGPRFLLKEICERLEIVHLIATEMNTNDGTILGENCKGNEKVKQFYERFPNGKIESFYSDSYSDKYLAVISEKSYRVKNNQVVDWKF